MLRDQIFNNPASMLASCLIWVPIGIWVLALVQWAVQGDMDVLSAFAGVMVGIGLGTTAMVAREPHMAPLILTAVVVTMLAFPVVRSQLNRRALDQIDIEVVERAYEALSQRPFNAAAQFKLARAVYRRGLQIQAVALAERAIAQLPESTFSEEHRILKSWRHFRLPPGDGSLSCLECGTLNAAGLTHCQRCGAQFLLHHAQGAWLGKKLARRFVAAWVAIVVALVGIPFAAGSMPPGVAIPVIIGLMVLAIGVLAATFRSTGGQAA